MPANTRARTLLRASLNVETLEGRAMPSAVIVNRPHMVDPGVVRAATGPQGVYVAGLSVANQLHNPGAMRVVSRIVVNGEVVAKFVGKPQFSAMGPALSTDANGVPVSAGGTTVCVNGRVIGTFREHPTVTRDAQVYVNRHGVAARVLTYHVTGQVYLPPSNPADAWVDCYPIGV
jgi:hypothetical protein